MVRAAVPGEHSAAHYLQHEKPHPVDSRRDLSRSCNPIWPRSAGRTAAPVARNRRLRQHVHLVCLVGSKRNGPAVFIFAGGRSRAAVPNGSRRRANDMPASHGKQATAQVSIGQSQLEAVKKYIAGQPRAFTAGRHFRRSSVSFWRNTRCNLMSVMFGIEPQRDDYALSGLTDLNVIRSPGRCPGLSHSAPSGRVGI